MSRSFAIPAFSRTVTLAGVSGNFRLPYKFLGISQEFIRQTGIPAHPCSQQTKQQFLARFFKISQSTKTPKIQDHAAVIDHKDVVKLTQLRNNPFARLSYLQKLVFATYNCKSLQQDLPSFCSG